MLFSDQSTKSIAAMLGIAFPSVSNCREASIARQLRHYSQLYDMQLVVERARQHLQPGSRLLVQRPDPVSNRGRLRTRVATPRSKIFFAAASACASQKSNTPQSAQMNPFKMWVGGSTRYSSIHRFFSFCSDTSSKTRRLRRWGALERQMPFRRRFDTSEIRYEHVRAKEGKHLALARVPNTRAL